MSKTEFRWKKATGVFLVVGGLLSMQRGGVLTLRAIWPNTGTASPSNSVDELWSVMLPVMLYSVAGLAIAAVGLYFIRSAKCNEDPPS